MPFASIRTIEVGCVWSGCTDWPLTSTVVLVVEAVGVGFFENKHPPIRILQSSPFRKGIGSTMSFTNWRGHNLPVDGMEKDVALVFWPLMFGVMPAFIRNSLPRNHGCPTLERPQQPPPTMLNGKESERFNFQLPMFFLKALCCNEVLLLAGSTPFYAQSCF